MLNTANTIFCFKANEKISESQLKSIPEQVAEMTKDFRETRVKNRQRIIDQTIEDK